MYHPLKGMPGNSSPPQSNSMPETAGRAYHFKPKSKNQSYLERRVGKERRGRGGGGGGEGEGKGGRREGENGNRR